MPCTVESVLLQRKTILELKNFLKSKLNFEKVGILVTRTMFRLQRCCEVVDCFVLLTLFKLDIV